MSADLEALAEWVESHFAENRQIPEILEHAPGLTVAQAFAIQDRLQERRLARGDRCIGWKMALTSKAMQERLGIPMPVYGHLWASGLYEDQAPLSAAPFWDVRAEPEIAVLLKGDLRGPGVDTAQALRATAGYLAAMEVGDMRAFSEKRSLQMVHACNGFNGGQLLGKVLLPPEGVDISTEGMVMRLNGEVMATAAAAEILGHPLQAIVSLANQLAERGQQLRAGMVILTGSLVPNIRVKPGDHVQVGFTRLGEVNLRLAP